MGVDLTDPTNERVPSFTLGVADVSPLEMAEAYATFAARGQHCDSRPVTSIEDANGNLLKEYGPSCTQVLTNAVADTVNDILKGVLEPGGFGQYITINQEDAGKTGTTQSARAVWFNGYTPNLSTATMLAGANSFGQPIGLEGLTAGGRYIYSASGSGLAGPIWGQAMGEVEQWLPDETFTPPDLSALGGEETTVPSVAGQPLASARRILEDAGFSVLVGSEAYSEYPEGTVAYSDPGSGCGHAAGLRDLHLPLDRLRAGPAAHQPGRRRRRWWRRRRRRRRRRQRRRRRRQRRRRRRRRRQQRRWRRHRWRRRRRRTGG